MASSSCYDTVYISNVYSIIFHVIGERLAKTRRKQARKKECMVYIYFYMLCVSPSFDSACHFQKNSPQEDVMSALVTVADSSFLGKVISSRGLLQHSMNINVCLIRYSFFFLYFIHSISVILWYDLPVEKKLCLVLELYFR